MTIGRRLISQNHGPFSPVVDDAELFYREAARCRRLAEGLTSASDRATMLRLAVENEGNGDRARAAGAWTQGDEQI